MQLICGVVRWDGRQVEPATLHAMCDAMLEPAQQATRRVWAGETAALAVLDFHPGAVSDPLSPGKPLAADVRLHAVAELRAQLGATPETGDEALLQTALERWNTGAFTHLLGDFAIATWDPATGELLLGRDAMGVRSLVYAEEPGKWLVFASFPRAIHASGLIERKIDTIALVREALHVRDAHETLFHGVRRLRPGAYLSANRAGTKETVYWRPELNRRRFRSRDEGVQALREAVFAAVRDRIGGSGPVGAHLSGGLDSSTLAILAARMAREQGRALYGYSFIEEEMEVEYEDETPFVQAVLEQEKDIRWKPISPGLKESADIDGGMAMTKLDRLLTNAADAPENEICADAASHGVDTILSGWGGDEAATFNARGAMADAFKTGRWRYLLREMNHLKRVRGFRRRDMIRGDVLSFLMPQVAERWRVFRGNAPALTSDRGSVIRRDVHSRAVAHGGDKSLSIGSGVRANQLQLTRGSHISFRAENWVEIGAPYGIAFSFPLLDPRVLDCALSMKSTWFQHKGWRRSLIREAMHDVLPEKILKRHTKLTPFPGAAYLLPKRKDRLVQEMEDLMRHPEVTAVFDEAFMRDRINAIPSMEEVIADPGCGSRSFAALGALGYARFLLRG